MPDTAARIADKIFFKGGGKCNIYFTPVLRHPVAIVGRGLNILNLFVLNHLTVQNLFKLLSHVATSFFNNGRLFVGLEPFKHGNIQIERILDTSFQWKCSRSK